MSVPQFAVAFGRQKKPELLVDYSSAIVANVLQELKRAQRTQEEEAIYREAVETATQPAALYAIGRLAAIIQSGQLTNFNLS